MSTFESQPLKKLDSRNKVAVRAKTAIYQNCCIRFVIFYTLSIFFAYRIDSNDQKCNHKLESDIIGKQ